MMTPPIASLHDLAHEIARLLPEYLPGMSTGPAALTEARSCWIQAWKSLLAVLGRERHMEIALHEEGDSALARQLALYWKRGDGIMAAFVSGWGDREEVERRFQTLETIKAPQKTFIYSCAKWQTAVIEQLGATLLRYPHHIAGEQYLTLNLLGTEQKMNAHSLVITRNGSLDARDLERFQPLPGSPFFWGGRPTEPQ